MSIESEAIATEQEGDELLSLDQAVRFLGISRPTIYRMLAQGTLKGLRVGRQWRFRQDDLVNHAMRQPSGIGPQAASDAETELEFFRAELARAGASPTGDDVDEPDPAIANMMRLNNAILELALTCKASDVHIEPRRSGDAEEVLVRYRVDGALQPVRRMPGRLLGPIIHRFKLMTSMDTGEKRLPQSGRARIVHEGRHFELRVDTVPVIGGEALTIRVLFRDMSLPDLDGVHMSDDIRSRFDSLIHRPNGLILVSGPTGSGKTTVLYAALQAVSDDSVKTVTVEDPVEFSIPNTTQVQINPRGGVTMASALRAIMRHDPDVIMSGEVVDPDTACQLVQAAITGHLVMCQLHADSAAAAIERFVSLCSDPYYSAAALVGALNQRLVRRVCDSCASELAPDSIEWQTAASLAARLAEIASKTAADEIGGARFRVGRGCPTCRMTGYKGRTAIYELVTINARLSEAIRNKASADEIAALAAAQGSGNLALDALLKVITGVTTADEVLRVLGTTF